MKRGAIGWRTKEGVQEITLLFMPDTQLEDNVVHWRFGDLLSNSIYEKKHIQRARSYVENEMTKIRTQTAFDGALFIHQYDLEAVFTSLAKCNLIPHKVCDKIMRFLADVPTPTKSRQVYTRAPVEEYHPKRVKHTDAEPAADAAAAEDSDEGSQEDEEEPLITRVEMACRIIDTFTPLVDRPQNDIFSTTRERSDMLLFLRNTARTLPKDAILQYLGGEHGEPIDDSPLVSVTQRVASLGYVLPHKDSVEGQRFRMDIGALAVRYYKKLHGGSHPPEIYRTYGGGERLLVIKWTLNNCHNTLDRAIHTYLQDLTK